MASENALGVAARCWCEPITETRIMDPALAEVFAGRVDGYLNLIEAAWGIIANAGGGNWHLETDAWQRAARGWRERYHAMLGNNCEVPTPEAQ